MKSDRLKRSFHNLKLALASLEQFVAEPVRTNRDRAGIIQAFEFTYELAWKTFPDVLPPSPQGDDGTSRRAGDAGVMSREGMGSHVVAVLEEAGGSRGEIDALLTARVTRVPN